MWHNPFHGYAPPNYTPNSKPDPEPDIPDSLITLAKHSGGKLIHKSGTRIFKWLYDKMYYADYDGSVFGSWFPWLGKELPKEELRDLQDGTQYSPKAIC